LDFEGGADNLRNDAATKRVYVGCGDDEKNGAIAAVDAMTNQRLDEEYKIGAEPESFQLENAGPNIYVSIPDLQEIAVINRETKKITRWPLAGLRKNFPWLSTRRITAYSSACANRPCFPCFAPPFVVELVSAGC
jgi:DNA-binding beta-propeller fold protein YncE